MLLTSPCLDSEELATARRRELDIDRGHAQALGASAVAAIEKGYYEDARGRRVDWTTAVAAARRDKVSIPPDDPLPAPGDITVPVTHVQVSNDTTLGAARRLVEAGKRPLALNFANGIHPGGGFLHGARAQEEVLCRSSALFATLKGDPMYDAHAMRGAPDSTSWTILSPGVPVFREDAGTLLDAPWLLDLMTCAAPVATVIGQPRAGDLLAQRIHRILSVAATYGYRSLVLGAWGCGAFRNDTDRTARDFRAALEGDFAHLFEDVTFAIADWSPERCFLGPFRDVFA